MNLPALRAPRRPFLCLSILCFVAFVAWGCATEPITGRWTLAPVPETTTSPMGTQAYAEILKDAKISTDAAANELVSRVGKRIAAVTDAHMKEENREPFQWEFKVIDDPKTVNAWCLPGGKVAFYTAILPVCKDENGIAVVMGHEVAHAYAQHGGRRMSEQGVANVGLQAVALALGGEGASDTAKLTVAALGIGYQVGVQLPFSRKDESSADYIGLMLMSEAGYDPRASVEFWKRMIQATGGAGPPEFLSTHPDPSNRIQRLEELMPKALEIYEKSKAKGGAAQIP